MGCKLTQTQINQLRANHNFYMLGRLTERISSPDLIEINYDNLKFDLLALTDDCDSTEFVNKNYLNFFADRYIGFDKNFADRVLPANMIARAEFLQSELKDKLVLFKPSLTVKSDISDYRIFKNINQARIISTSLFECDHFERVPKINMKLDVFLKKLYNHEYVELNEYSSDLPHIKYILCDNILFKFNLGDWESHTMKTQFWKYKGLEFGIKACHFAEAPKELMTECTSFIPTDWVEQMEYINIDELVKSIDNGSKEDNIKISYDTESTGATKLVPEEETSSEMNFIKALYEYCNSKHLKYYLSDLVNLHTCIKTNSLTILSGPTGTGKSALAQAYAHMLDTSEANNNLLFMPVSPSFLEPEDVFGYLDENQHRYVTAPTGLVDFLLQASKNPDKIYIAIFEEMNLSQIELWFAPMLSLMERDEEDRYLQLYPANADICSSCKYPNRIKIGCNVKFIGTINQDETTKILSDRLLDRINLVTLQQVKFADLIIKGQEKCIEEITKNIIEKEVYDSWVLPTEIPEVFDEGQLAFFDSLQEVLSHISNCKRLSFRALKAMANYIHNLPTGSSNVLSTEDAFDMLVKQRILSKIKGSELLPNHVHGDEEDIYKSCELLNFLGEQDTQKISHFNQSRTYIREQLREMYIYGYNY